MKKCPFCKAEIEENTRFCLYCMSPLEEKQVIEALKEKKKWGFIIPVAILLSAILIILAMFLFKKESPANKNSKSPQNTIDKVIEPDQEDDADDESTDSSPDATSQEKTPTGSASQDKSTNSSDSKQNTTGGEKEPEESTPNSTGGTPTTPVTPAPKPSVTTATYLYRDAKYGDDFSVGANLENAVVITGVSTPSSSGEYIIPDTINNKRVVAIMGLAFSDSSIKNTVKKVVVSANVKTIWNNAFANCSNLTDIYFCGKAIYVEVNAFPSKANRAGTLTIHCSYDCTDRNYRYYRNSATYYDAQYKEWNN